MDSYGGSVAASTTASVSKTVNLDLSQNNQVQDADLIVLTLKVSAPDNVQQINLQFDLNGSGYTNYFQKSISPQLYQSGITGTSDPYTALSDQVYAQNLQQGTSVLGSNSGLKVLVRDVPVDGGGSPGGGGAGSQLNPANLSTGPGAWITVYIPIGDFLPVGLAGQYNQTWANVTGWRIQIITNSNSGGTSFGLNALYLQWGAGPSSYGGIGYDYRYTYYNFNTGTESNPSQIMYYDQKYGTPSNLAPLIVLRQGILAFGLYSGDPQVTHVRIYRRGGSLGENWIYVDQVPNVLNTTGTSLFFYFDIIPDSDLQQSDILVLDNDVPVTSSLPNPISTTLTFPVGGQYPLPPGNAYSVFESTFPWDVRVDDPTAVFVTGQIVDVGTPQNLEQVYVITGGVGSFTGTLRLQHAAGEQVQVFSLPGQAVDLVELAYGQMWWAGDPNNPHYLYYSKTGLPENCGPQNYIPVSEPSDPITGIINFRGTLYAATRSTWYLIVGGGGQVPYAQVTGSKHGLVAKHGYCQTESSVWYQAIDGIREFRGADGPYRSLIIEWIFRNNNQTPVPLADLNNLGSTTMGYWQNYVYISYVRQP